MRREGSASQTHCTGGVQLLRFHLRVATAFYALKCRLQDVEAGGLNLVVHHYSVRSLEDAVIKEQTWCALSTVVRWHEVHCPVCALS